MHKLVWFLSSGLLNASFLASRGSSRVDAEHRLTVRSAHRQVVARHKFSATSNSDLAAKRAGEG